MFIQLLEKIKNNKKDYSTVGEKIKNEQNMSIYSVRAMRTKCLFNCKRK